MARSYAPLYTSIWSDPSFTARTAEAQRVFLLALSQANISYAGVLSYTARRWARMAHNTTVADIEKAVGELVEARFLLLDEDTEEVMVRSFVRHNGVLKQPQLRKAMDSAYADILSPHLRAAFLKELPEPERRRLTQESRSEPLEQPADHPSGSLPEGSNKLQQQQPAEPVSVSTPQPSSSSPTCGEEEEEDEAMQQAKQLLANRDPSLPQVANVTQWLKTTAADIRCRPDLSSHKTPPARPYDGRRPDCSTCEGLALIDTDAGYAPCPDCTPRSRTA